MVDREALVQLFLTPPTSNTLEPIPHSNRRRAAGPADNLLTAGGPGEPYRRVLRGLSEAVVNPSLWADR